MKKIFLDIRTYFLVLLWGSIGYFAFQMIRYPILPTKYLTIVYIVLGLLGIILSIAQYKTKKVFRFLGKVCIVLVSALLIFVNFTYLKATSVLNSVKQTEDIDVVSVIVKTDSDYKYIEDLFGKQYSTVENRDSYVDATFDAISDDNNEFNLKIRYFSGYNDMIDALYDESVDCIVINEAYRALIEENYETFSTDTKVIYSKEYRTAIEAKSLRSFDVTVDPFSVYISGIDTYGSISTKSRSDVNILMTVNPIEKKILLVSIPRDYYIPFIALDGQSEKLTHSGIYGVEETVSDVANFLEMDIPYYVRINFDSLIDIVDAIGGVDVDNPQSFLNFPAGLIHLNGQEALTFSRERYSFSSGDRERGRNQMRVITGIINKVCSPEIITKAFDLLDSLHSSFQTNLTDSEILSLIRMQLDDMASWSIESISVDGYGETAESLVYGGNVYVMVPYEDSVAYAKERIDALYR